MNSRVAHWKGVMRMSGPNEGSGAGGWFEGHNALVEQDGGKVNIYFNDGNPLGPGHGHIVTNADGGVEYWRRIGESQADIDSRR